MTGSPVLMGLFCLASLAITLGLLAWEIRRQPLPIPLATLISAHYLVFYALFPALDPYVVGSQQVPRWLDPSTMVFILAAQLLMACGVAVVASIGRDVPRHAESLDRAARLMAWGALGGHFAFILVPELRGLPSINQLEQPLWLFGLGVLVWGFLSRRFGPTESVMAVLAILAKVGLQVTSGFITQMVLSLSLALALALAFRRLRLAALALALAGMAVLAYVPIKTLYNILHDRDNFNAFDRFHAADQGMGMDATFGLGHSIHYATRRSAHGLLLQQAINKSPAEIPFWGGESLKPLLWSHVPRAVWPGKPREEMGNTFGRVFDLLNPRDMSTSWNMPWLVEFYVNFGHAGALAAMAAAGAVLGLLGRLLDRSPRGAFAAGLAAGTYFPLFHQESNVSVMAGNVLWMAAIFTIAHWILLRWTGTSR